MRWSEMDIIYLALDYLVSQNIINIIKWYKEYKVSYSVPSKKISGFKRSISQTYAVDGETIDGNVLK